MEKEQLWDSLYNMTGILFTRKYFKFDVSFQTCHAYYFYFNKSDKVIVGSFKIKL